MKTLESKNLNHHGIVAAACGELQIREIIDSLMPAGNRKKLSFGQLVEGMIVNGLGFTTKPLYLTPMFFEDTAVETIFGDGIKAEDFSDDSLGRCLDKMSEFGIEEIFSRIAYQACKKFAVDTRFQHLDTSVMQLEGEYDTATELIRFGRPKKGRSDLKQFLISMMVSNDGGVPLLANVIAGNKSDQTHFREVLKRLGDSMKASNEDIYHVADAALYTKQNIQELDDSPIKFITRVPSSLTEAQELFKQIPLESMQDDDDNYKIHPLCSFYDGVKQRWLLVLSKAALKKELKTMYKSIRKERRELRKEINKIERRSFLCEADTQKAIKLFKTKKYHKLKTTEVIKKEIKRTPGEVFKVQLKVCLSKEKVLIEKKLRGKFIIASNELEDFSNETRTLDYKDMLAYYKNQSKVEQGFRFLNDPLCMADAIYLKNESRIKSLVCVMCICLLVYSIAQRKLRTALKEQEEYLQINLVRMFKTQH
ncbi:MAG: IS1634 family transposase [Candidatus Melainabacteria bacterium]|nr:IS1634 family transposase [Candidatus Melainabacteria bacterium]